MAETDGVSPLSLIQKNKKIKYVILGCGSIGYNVLGELHESDDNVLIVDFDEKRLDDLRDHRHQVMLGDMTD